MNEAIAICLVELPATPPAEIMLMPLPAKGDRLEAADGRIWRLKDAAKVVRTSRQRMAGRKFPIDYEHQTDFARENGQPAPAAGWIHDIKLKADGIYAAVEWTAKATQHIRDKEYRYISPTFAFTPSNGNILAILRAGLVNSPALEMPALAKWKPDTLKETKETKVMKKSLLDKILAAVGLTATASEADVETALAKLQSDDDDKGGKGKGDDKADTLGRKIREKLGLAAEATEAEVETALAKLDTPGQNDSGEDDNGDGAVGSEMKALAKKVDKLTDGLKTVVGAVEKLSTARTEESVTAQVDEAIKARKIIPAQRDQALALCKADPDAFKQYVEAAAPLIGEGEQFRQELPGDGDKSHLAPHEVAVCNAMGLDHTAFAAQRDKHKPATKQAA